MSNDYITTKLGNVGKVSMCKRVLKQQTANSGDIPFYKISTFGDKPNAYISRALYDEFRENYSFPKKGEILISAAGTLGKTVIYDGEPAYFQDSNIVWIENDETKILNSYLYYFYQTDPWLTTSGSTINRIYNDNLKNITLNHPASLIKQQEIASVLSTIDAKIDCNKRIHTELESLARMLYVYWFIQFDFPDENYRPYKSSGGKMIYNGILKREIPIGWHNAIIEDILDKAPSSVKVLNQDILASGNIPVLDQGQNYISGFTNDISALIEPKQPHVVFGDHTRAVKLVNFNYARGADGTQILVSKDNRLPGYLMYQTVARIDLSNYGYARHFKFLKEAMIILPEESISSKYQAIVSPMYEKIQALIIENLELSKLRDWLLPMLMNGQVTIS